MDKTILQLLCPGPALLDVPDPKGGAVEALLGVRPLRAGDGPPLPLGRQLRGQGQPQDLRHLPHPHGLHAGAGCSHGAVAATQYHHINIKCLSLIIECANTSKLHFSYIDMNIEL